MDDARFISVLNRSLTESGLDLSAPASPGDPKVVTAWADFLRRCAAAGVSIADPRWRELEIRRSGGTTSLVMRRSGSSRTADTTDDFTLGLSLLMSMLEREPDKEDC
jgi:hypothetical protein